MDDHCGAQFTGPVTAHPACDGTLVTDLVTRASTGDKQAWDALVERYAPLIWSICGKYRLSRADAEDVGQNVWLRLAGQLERSAIRPRCPGGSPPLLAGSAGGSCAQHTGCPYPPTSSTPGASRASRRARPTRNCSRPSGTRRYATHSAACRRTASS